MAPAGDSPVESRPLTSSMPLGVLLADPDASARAALSHDLIANGYRVVQAVDGEEALDRFRRIATEDEVLRVMAKPIAYSTRPARNDAIAADGTRIS